MKDTGKVDIHGKSYETVASRVHRFREEVGHKFSIETHIISVADDNVVMRALIRDVESDKIIATGHAEESRQSSTINRTSALENCETSAIGRALAAFGLAGTEFASADELVGALNQQRTPQKPSVGTPAKPILASTITPPQLKKLQAMFGEYGMTDRAERLAYTAEIVGHEVASATGLTTGEAAKVINALDLDLAGVERLQEDVA